MTTEMDRRRALRCQTCNGPSRKTTGLVCQTCGWDYGNDGEPGTLEQWDEITQPACPTCGTPTPRGHHCNLCHPDQP